MQKICSEVEEDTFLDPSTHIRHPCTYICNVDDPVNSPIDCAEQCPEFNRCLLRSLIETTSTLAAPTSKLDSITNGIISSQRQSPDVRMITILLSMGVICVSIIAVTLIGVYFVRKRQRRSARDNGAPLETLPLDELRQSEHNSTGASVRHASDPNDSRTQLLSPDSRQHDPIHDNNLRTQQSGNISEGSTHPKTITSPQGASNLHTSDRVGERPLTGDAHQTTPAINASGPPAERQQLLQGDTTFGDQDQDQQPISLGGLSLRSVTTGTQTADLCLAQASMCSITSDQGTQTDSPCAPEAAAKHRPSRESTPLSTPIQESKGSDDGNPGFLLPSGSSGYNNTEPKMLD